jgi:hypothetical protein
MLVALNLDTFSFRGRWGHPSQQGQLLELLFGKLGNWVTGKSGKSDESWDDHGQIWIGKKVGLKFILSIQFLYLEALDAEVGRNEIVRGH